MLSIEGVCLHRSGTEVLSDINCQLNEGELIALLGPNGAGKSTLIQVASGEATPDQGSVRFFERPLADWKPNEKARLMSVLPQHSTLNFSFQAKEVVALGRTPHSSGFKHDRAIIESTLKATDTLHLKDKLYTQLSGGEKQRVQLARILAQAENSSSEKPNILILDEPTSALDLSHRQKIMQILKDRTKEGATVLVALHDLNLAASFADKIIIMCDGRIHAQGTPDEVLEERLLQDVFKLEFNKVPHPKTGLPVLLY